MGISLAKSLRADGLKNISLRPVCGVEATTPVQQVIDQMVQRRTGCALVMNRGKLVGIFTERDFVSRVVSPGLDVRVPVEQVMTPNPTILNLLASVQLAIETLEAGGFRHLPIVDDGGQPIGVLSIKDIIHYLVGYFPANVYNLPPRPDQVPPAREGA